MYASHTVSTYSSHVGIASLGIHTSISYDIDEGIVYGTTPASIVAIGNCMNNIEAN